MRRVMPPGESRISALYPRADLLDSYRVDLVKGELMSMRAIADQALASKPIWFSALLGTRDRIMALFGVKTTRDVLAEVAPERRISFFPIIDESENEIVLGIDDSHLDFRLSIFRQIGEHGVAIYATTVVQTHNLIGRLYISVIRPFHVAITRSMVARLKA